MTNIKTIFQSLFLIQLMASFLVFAGHYTAGLGSFIEITPWETYLNHVSRYGTALLAIITGFFTVHSLEFKKSSAFSFFKGKFIYIFVPYLLIGIYYHHVLYDEWPQSFSDFLDIFLGKTGGHLYFVFMLLQYYVFAYVYRHIVTKKTIFYMLPLFLGIQMYFIYSDFWWDKMGVRHFLPTWLFTLYLGHFLYWYKEEILTQIKRNIGLQVLLLMFSIVSILYFTLSSTLYTANHVRFVLSTFIIIVTILFVLPQWIGKIKIPFQKGLTFYIYLSHPAFIMILNQMFLKERGYQRILENKMLSLGYLALIYTVTLLVSWVASMLMNRMEWIESHIKKNLPTIKQHL